MKVNKEVSDLARKLKYIGHDEKERRRLIKNCLNPIETFFFGKNPLIKMINEGYEILKKEFESYEILDKENKNLQEKYNQIRKDIYPLKN
jgi:hypothetical protein